jgi:Flp pilus assembly protein TadB
VSVALAALCAGILLAGVVGLVAPPTARLGPRLRPYTVGARARLGRPVDIVAEPDAPPRGAFERAIGAGGRSAMRRLSRIVERRGDDALELALVHAGFDGVTPDDYRSRVAFATVLGAGAGAALGVLALHSAALTLALVAVGAVAGASRTRARLDRAIAERRERMRLELYTVNQLLAMHVRTGAGPIQATRRVVERGRGVLVEELGAVLRMVRSGTSEPDAFRRAAARTAEPAAARTFKLFAAGAERGVDLGAGLRALSEDLRDARRDEIRTTATKRRAAMLVPTIAVLAPVMLLFIAAPLPSIVFGAR